MPLKGKAFLGMWHDVERGCETDYHLWHTREHMPERLSLPGFLRGRRGVNLDLPRQQYLTLYEGETLEVFRSPEYLDRLNRPTRWSAQMAGHFRNFLRVACDTVCSVGGGVGGGVATVRAQLPPALDEAAFVRAAPGLASSLLALEGVCAVHVGVARPEYSDVPTAETDLRPEMRERGFDAAILVEGVGIRELEALGPPIGAALRDAGIVTAQQDVYGLAYLLGRDGGS
jgi:hypothetical protein